MSFYKFGQVTISSKEFYEAVVIDIKTLNVDNILVSDPLLDNKKGNGISLDIILRVKL